MKTTKTLLLLLTISLFVGACNKEEEEEPVVLNPIVTPDPDPEPDPTSPLIKLPNGDQTITGNLSNGEVLNDLSWAWNSSMACFVEPGKSWFEGSHVFYQIDLPENSTIDIFLDAANSSDDIALYAYSKGAGSTQIPPNISSSVSCEAQPSNSAPVNGQKTVSLNAINNPFSIIIGVAGSAGLTSGEYTLTIDIES